MKLITTSLAATVTICMMAVSAPADPVPNRSKAFKANYKTLVQDQHATPPIAECIATAYDYVAASRVYDRLGFTQTDISKAKKGQTAIAVSGEARTRGTSAWVDITLTCVSAKGKLSSISIKR
ncbi:BspC domain-containing protein [Phyllobacterium zundukense]|uniref:Uncharacterized protein n=1 Tax=Phyllobacterium zundukense TaxID=1867719 RepID=A0ACD4CZ12_9HYPH|nr:hypothetical protein N8E88_07515 [Phyllobacterium zundukense]